MSRLNWFRPVLLIVSLLVSSPGLRAETPADAEQAIVELHKSGKLFDKTQYKTVRAAFTRLFEQKHDAQIAQAYGEDRTSLASWLDSHAEIKESFYTAVDERYDKLPAALGLFRAIWKKSPAQLEKYPNLAIATAVTWDDERAVYDYRGHQVRTKSTLPDGTVDGLANFDYMVANEKITEGRLRWLPWEYLVFVVDHRTPLDEREWARKYYQKARGVVKSWHQDVPYDRDMLRGEQDRNSGLQPHLAGKPYTLSNIRKEGGVCAQQADFAARVAKSVGVPAVYCWGQSSYRGLHAWWMFVQIQSANKEQIRFSLVSDGRIQGFLKDQFFTGNVIDPQTGREMLDRDMEHRLWVVGRDPIGKRQANLVLRAYPWLSQRLDFDVKARVAYLDRSLKLLPSCESAWLEFARLCKEGELDSTQKGIVRARLDSLTLTFGNHPDFIARLVDDLLTVQPNPNEKIRQYEVVYSLFEKKQRPDLACAARLKITELLCEQGRWPAAGKGLISTIRKFPNEGRYVPQMTQKLQEVVPHYKEGPAALAQLYVELVPTMIVYYGKEGSDYCDKLFEQASAFLQESKLDKYAVKLKAQTENARLRAAKP
jgi:hypothetical protein